MRCCSEEAPRPHALLRRPAALAAICALLQSLFSTGAAQCGERGMFACSKTELCVPQYKNCDGHNDCPDASDERNCTDVEDNRFWDHMWKKRPNADLDEEPRTCELEFTPPVCQCHAQDLLCQYAGLNAPPTTLPPDGLRTLDLSGNQLAELSAEVLKPIPDINSLILSYASIGRFLPDAFVNRTSLRHLHLNNNRLSHLPEPSFPEANNLRVLVLSHNALRTVPPGAFRHLRHLLELDLRNNLLTTINRDSLAPLVSLTVLYLNSNQLEKVPNEMFPPLPRLSTLSLANNKLVLLEPGAFEHLSALQHLYLNNNLLRILENGTFTNLVQLRSLKLKSNNLQELAPGVFSDLHQLISLDLQENKLNELNHDLLLQLTLLQYVYLDHFRLCAAARHVRVCEPHGDGISSLDHLLDSALLRSSCPSALISRSVWAMAVVACLGNVLVLLGRILLRGGQRNAVHSLYITNLALSDLLMGCYLFAIATADWRFRGHYVLVEAEWRRSTACKFCGFLSTLSAQSSVLILSLITWDRLSSVVRPLAGRRQGGGGGGAGRPASARAAAAQAAALWATAAAAAGLPLTRAPPFGDSFYGGNGVCLPLHIHEPYAQGWQYSAALFILAYALALSFICGAYWHMLRAVRRSRLALRSTREERQDGALARRFALIVLTDCACWAPVVAAKLLALAGVNIQQDLYAWLAVCVMPVNSALNPVLYTLTTQVFKQQAARVLCAWRQCNGPLSSRVDSLSLSAMKDGAGGSVQTRFGRSVKTGSTGLHSGSSWKGSQGATLRATKL